MDAEKQTPPTGAPGAPPASPPPPTPPASSASASLEAREHLRRRREAGIAIGGVLTIVVLVWVELKLLGVTSYLFLGLVNLNFILLLVVLFVVGRNGVKLMLERRRNVLGSKLRSRLVLAFILLSLVPVALMSVHDQEA